MSMSRREFLQLLAVASSSGIALNSKSTLAANDTASFYDLPAYGNVSIMHFTDCHAQLKPVYFREPDVNIGLGSSFGKPPHLVGEELLKLELAEAMKEPFRLAKIAPSLEDVFIRLIAWIRRDRNLSGVLGDWIAGGSNLTGENENV